jgi:hypothetical protein
VEGEVPVSELTGEGSERLRAQQFEVPVDRSRVCPGPHPSPEQLEALGGEWTCPWCANTGRILDDGLSEQAKRLRYKPIPAGHPALSQEQFIPDLETPKPPRRR